MKKFTEIVKMTEKQLKSYLAEELRAVGYDPIVGDGFVYAKGTGCTVLLTAHMDTVHKEPVKQIIACGNVLSSPQGIGGDDRCGIHIITRIINETDMRPSILFCEQEEAGGKGANKFIKTGYVKDLKELKFLVEIDRRGSNDAVFYSCDNPDFTNFILDTTGREENFGSFSDICVLSPECGVASVNFSCGYHDEHTLKESVNLVEMENTTSMIKNLLAVSMTSSVPQYDYYEYYFNWSWNKSAKSLSVYIVAIDQNGTEIEEIINANSMDEGVGLFMQYYPNICFSDIVELSSL